MEAASHPLDTAAHEHLRSWIGRTETGTDDIVAAPVRALSATLDRNDPEPQAGMPLPALWHWLYFLPRHAHSALGVDGHARRGDFLPPVPLPRRMWAGGRLAWQPGNPLRIGDTARRTSRIVSVEHKAGRSGDLVFVLVRHEVHNAAGLSLTEEHDIVYRTARVPGSAAPPPMAAPADPSWQRSLTPDAVLLFRYSALTFNGHRIHYDRSYATEAEGYPGLVVHGPLVATLLLDLLRRQLPQATLRAFEFKALRPSFDGRPLRLNGQRLADGPDVQLWAQDHEGWITMQARAQLD